MAIKTEDVAEKTPVFADIRDEVAAAWKQQKASELALKQAEKFATEAAAAGETLTNFMAGKPFQVVTTDLFSWLNFGSTAEIERGTVLG